MRAGEDVAVTAGGSVGVGGDVCGYGYRCVCVGAGVGKKGRLRVGGLPP